MAIVILKRSKEASEKKVYKNLNKRYKYQNWALAISITLNLAVIIAYIIRFNNLL